MTHTAAIEQGTAATPAQRKAFYAQLYLAHGNFHAASVRYKKTEGIDTSKLDQEWRDARKKMDEAYRESQEAYHRGDHYYARKYSREGRVHENEVYNIRVRLGAAVAARNEASQIYRNAQKNYEAANKTIAELAGVPHDHLENLRVVFKPNGAINLYFGGQHTADGPEHGHYSIDTEGNVTYLREQGAERGAHNYTGEGQQPSLPATT